MDGETLRLVEVAKVLGIKPSNVTTFLDRRGIVPIVDRPHHRRWALADILAAKADYEALGRRGADERRRTSALRRDRA